MANDFIVNKWRLWFRAIDINHRGEISRADVNDEEETFAKLSHLDSKRKKDMKEKLDQLWENIIFRGRPGAIKEDEFVEMNSKLYTADKAKFQDEMKRNYTSLFSDIIDIGGEGSITEKEYVDILKACGHENIALSKKFFDLYNPVDGKVPVQVMIDSWTQFTTCDDSSKRDIVKEGIESGY